MNQMVKFIWFDSSGVEHYILFFFLAGNLYWRKLYKDFVFQHYKNEKDSYES